ncbi:DNA glycosylase [Rhizophagus irregularis]|uniref:N-glycosylase/DNA lyase n=3 Tax=Rhizophagus irregularis TaxID=588596 RepID=A0A2I1EW00_9GLOM|nr:8-oxoguanine glycosylase OGG1 [Rhizophagus irregularis DAOM 197198w]PKC05646.1 DNA glycosylase [Rhizophagus irregularis]GBC31442.1 N-glycosylase/DNA lyase [Rhizophagus irregularis DAOM 181602=DAOM 197198]PKC61622.1 DNA glycosylase [Rhizophagus irregularis]PKK74736.1 DNA glycosylase [Rhizophagus irregularis]
MSTVWRTLKVSAEELRLDKTLKCGQSFRWKVSGKNEWSCAFKGRLITLKQTPSDIEYRTYCDVSSFHELDKLHEFLIDYFQLNTVSLSECYTKWSKADKHFAKIAQKFKGIRILRQDPIENLFCFICSTNNNINRITQMVEKLCRQYGDKVYTLNGEDYFDFPTLEKLTSPNVEDELRKLGFGYRARYIVQTAKYICENFPDGNIWLYNLRNLDYKEAHAALLKLSGVGPKVADCVCLMSLNKHNAIPVDTHVWQIAQRKYGFSVKTKGKSNSLTSRNYEAVGDHFRKIFGEYSGWAHSVLFTSDLRAFEDRSIIIEQELDLTSPTTPITTGKRGKLQMRGITSKPLNIVREKNTNNNKRPRRS